MSKHTENNCQLYQLGLCPMLHDQEYLTKKLNISNGVKTFSCNGCNKTLCGKLISINGSSNLYTFCYKCCLEYCSDMRSWVNYQGQNFILSRTSIDKIRQQLNCFDPKQVEYYSNTYTEINSTF